MKSSILLTGGMGYVGGRLAIALQAAGHIVYCGTRRKDLISPSWCHSLRMRHLDWDSNSSLRDACKGIDCVIHLSAMNEIDAASDPIGSLNVNGVCSLRLLEAAKTASVRRFIYFSTAHVYGSPLKGHIDETTLARPVHPYAISHKVMEDFVLAAHDSKKIQGIVFRLSNGFGSPATHNINRWTLLVNDLCRQAVMTGVLRLNSSGFQLRDFVTLGDVSSAVNHMVQLDNSKLADGLFNLGSGVSVSILSMTELVAKRWSMMTGKEIEIVRPSVKNENNLTLTYSCEKLVATGFKLLREDEIEIDNTLKLCQKAFSN